MHAFDFGLIDSGRHLQDIKLHITQQRDFSHKIRTICMALKKQLNLDKKMIPEDTLLCLKTYIERQIKRG